MTIESFMERAFEISQAGPVDERFGNLQVQLIDMWMLNTGKSRPPTRQCSVKVHLKTWQDAGTLEVDVNGVILKFNKNPQATYAVVAPLIEALR